MFRFFCFVFLTAWGFLGCTSLRSQGTVQNSAWVVPGKGSLWLPFAWVPSVDFKAIEVLEIRDVAVVFQDVQSKSEILLPLKTGSPGFSQHGILSVDSPKKTFFLDRLTYFKPGFYDLISVRLFVVPPQTSRPVPLQIPIQNPSGSAKPLRFLIREGLVSLLPRFLMTSEFFRNSSELSSKQNSVIFDPDSLPAALVSANGVVTPEFVLEDRVFPGSDDFPRIRWPLNAQVHRPVIGQVGAAKNSLVFFLDAPCKAKGSFLFFWKRVGFDSEYVSLIDPKSQCAEQDVSDTFGVSVHLKERWRWIPQGSSDQGEQWSLYALQVLKPSPSEKIKFEHMTQEQIDYFKFDKWDSLFLSQKPSKILEKPFTFMLDTSWAVKENDRKENHTFAQYAGHFTLKPEGDDSFVTYFKRTFTVKKIKEVFNVSTLINAYSGEILEKDRPKGSIQLRLRTTAEESQSQRMQADAAELKKRASQILTQCVSQVELTNPLAVASGQVMVRVLRGAEQLVLPKSLNPRSHSQVAGPTSAQNQLTLCFHEGLSAARFEPNFSSTFQGEFFFIFE